VTTTQRYTVDGITYDSLDEMPPEAREKWNSIAAVVAAMQQMQRSGAKSGGWSNTRAEPGTSEGGYREPARAPMAGMRLRLEGLLMILVGALFIAKASFAYLRPAATAIGSGRILVFTATKRVITWSHVYAWADHPLVFSIEVLPELLGCLAFAGLGLLLGYVGIRVTFGPVGPKVSPGARRAGLVWAYACLACMLLWLLSRASFPYLARYGFLS